MNSESELNPDLSQAMVNKVAEMALASQLDSAQKIDVNLDSDTSQLLQGKTNYLSIAGEKIVTLDNIRLEKIDIVGEDLALNLTEILFGKVVFERPGSFKVKFVFTESDCDRLLSSEYVRILLQNLDLEIEQQPAHFYLQRSKCSLGQQDKLSMIGEIVLEKPQQSKTVPFKIAFQFEHSGGEIGFRGGEYLEDRVLNLKETVAIMNKISDLLYLRHFQNEDLAGEIAKIQIRDQQLIIQTNIEIKRLPNSISQSLESVSSEINH
ncbi:MAG: DUF2993 domain-containing protein [Cyanobacteria bacterium J06600_6]